MVSYSPLVQVLRHALRRFPALGVAVVLSIVSAVTELAAMVSLFPLAELAVGRHVDPHSTWGTLTALAPKVSAVTFFLFLFLGLLLLRLTTASVVAIVQAQLHRRMIAHFSANAFEAFVKHLNFREIHDRGIGHFITLAGDEANRASQIVVACARLVPILLLALLYLVALFAHSAWVGLAVIGFLAAMGLGMIGAFRHSHDLGVRQQAQSRSLNSYFVDALSSLRTIRAFNSEGFAASRYRTMIEEYARTCFSVDAVNVLGRAVPAGVLLLGFLVASSVWLNADLIANELAFAMAATVIVLRFLPLIGQALDTLFRITADLRAGQNVADVVDVAESIGRGELAPEPDAVPHIERVDLDNVSFSYAPDTPVLSGFSVSLQAGRVYALAGASGSGKSTLVDLLLGFEVPTSGRILFNGREFTGEQFRALRHRIAVVEQQPRLLNDTIADNLALGRNVNESELSRALSTACLDDVIAALPEGLDSAVAFQGSNLSGGQRQRVGIARALVKAADVLILDESTTGLDAQTRDRVVRNLRTKFRDKILVFLTHDKELLRLADEVISLDKNAHSLTSARVGAP